MKNALQTLLIFFALCLCGLCSWQWYSQVLQRREMTAVLQTNHDQAMAIHSATNSINALDRQIALMDTVVSKLKDTVATNNIEIITLRRENTHLTYLQDQYSNAVVVLQAQIKQANENIVVQNDAMKKLVEERNEFVTKLNGAMKDRNELVGKYNEVVKQMEDLVKQRDDVIAKYKDIAKQYDELQSGKKPQK